MSSLPGASRPSFRSAVARHLAIACLALVGVSSARAIAIAQDTTAVVTLRGRVSAQEGGQPVESALVVVRAASSAGRADVVDSTRTDGRGIYNFRVRGDVFTVRVFALGFTPRAARLVRRDAVRDIIADVRLARAVYTLSPVRVEARPTQPPALEDRPRSSPGGNERQPTPDALSPGGRGDLAALAATVPGVTLTSGGFSVLGLSPSQNATTLNGLSVAATAIPRTATVLPRLVTTAYDPAVGGFSGGQLALFALPGSEFTVGTLGLLLDDPRLQWTDAAGESLGQRYRNLQVSATRAGPLVHDRLFYSVSAQVGRRTNDLATLTNSDATVLARAGLSPEATDSVLATLQALRVPTSAGVTGDQTATTSGSLLARFDLRPAAERVLGDPEDALTAAPLVSGRSMNVVTAMSWARTTPTLLGPTTLPSRGAAMTDADGSVQFDLAMPVAGRVLLRARTGLSARVNRVKPLLELPGGTVLVGSTLADGSPGLATVQFGGATAAQPRQSQWSWETQNEASWHAGRNDAHRLRATVNVRLEHYSEEQTIDRLGTFTFNSPDDLASGRPSSFTRTLTPTRSAGRALSAALALGDFWRVGERLQLEGGLRLEANRLGPAPRRNPLLDTLFGVRTDRVPSGLHLSPRIGFTWSYGHDRRGTIGGGPARGTFRGGVGEFRAVLPPTLLAPVRAATGLPDATRHLLCLGPAAPTPDWAAYVHDAQTIPTACVPSAEGEEPARGGATAVRDGSDDSPFIDAAPGVMVFDPRYDAARSWRANIGWSGHVLGRFQLSVDALVSRTLGIPGVWDLNFAGVPRFTLPDEGQRAVFVPPTAVDPASGVVDPVAARVSDRVGRVARLSSDLQSESRQLSVSLAPAMASFADRTFWSIGYSYTRVRDRTRGFDGAAFDDPRPAGWARSAGDVRHQLNGTLSWSPSEAVQLTLYGYLRSGVPFTPLIAGDVNGDGVPGDLAFVADPARTADTALARQMATLLRSTSPGVRRCLERQLGRPAERNGCTGPWTAMLGAGVDLDGHSLGLPRRSRIEITLTNALAGIDQLLHGERGLRGWGQPPAPDPTLLTVTGFDPVAQRFRYAVNPAFGDTRPARSVLRTPFQITIEVSLPLGPPASRQLLDQVLRPGRGWPGQRRTAEQIKERYARAGFPNPIAQLILASDSLRLTREQEASLRTIDRRLTAATDSIWSTLAEYLATLDERYDDRSVRSRVRDSQTRAWDALAAAVRDAVALLTPEQLARAAPEVAWLLTERGLREARRAELLY